MEVRYREESQMVRAAQEAVMHRPNFAIDAIGDSDGEEDEEEGEEETAAIMNEVERFLAQHEADDEGLKGEQKKVATGECLEAPGVWISEAEILLAELLKAEPMGAKASGDKSDASLVDI